MKNTLEINKVTEHLLACSKTLKRLHEADPEYSPERNYLPNAIVFLGQAIDELLLAGRPDILKVV